MANLAARLGCLRSWQNPDGGWGYFPGKRSWLEPTVWSALALTHHSSDAGTVDGAWRLVRSWQNADGGWRPSASVGTSTWATALAVTFADVLGHNGIETEGRMRWLIKAGGAESSLLNRLLRALRVSAVEREVKYAGWPWRLETSAWVEPTAHALVALKKVAHRNPEPALAARIDSGERMLLSVRCSDGGWNYGSPRALGRELPSYAETSALALIGLQDRAPADAIEHARKLTSANVSPLARAWLRLGTGETGAVSEDTEPTNDVLVTALESVPSWSPRVKMSRRAFASGAAIAATAGYATMRHNESAQIEKIGGAKSKVAILKASSYSQDLVRPIIEGIRACGLDVRGKTVLLKPNLVEFDHATAINTDAAVVGAAYEAFHQAGAASVMVGEGPGHRRDTFDLAREARYPFALPRFNTLFTDLNRDDVTGIADFADEGSFFFPNAAMRADVIVSLAKMKTHHWAGVTLSMKNLFGLVPGSVYGWPKNRLHYIGITRSILELNRIFASKAIALVDGITGMEGNGPIQGRPKHAGVLVMGRDLRAVDATCCRIMGIEPVKIEYLQMGAFLGHIEDRWIEQWGEDPAAITTEFDLIPEFAMIRRAF